MHKVTGISEDKLYQLANARVGLSVVADHLADIVKHGTGLQAISHGICDMLDVAAELCNQPNNSLIK